MTILLKSFVFFLLASSFMVGGFFLGEWVTGKLPNSLWAKWWRKNVVEDGEHYPD